MKTIKSRTSLLVTVAMVLPVLLYCVFFWRSGVITSSDAASAMFQPGVYFNTDAVRMEPTFAFTGTVQNQGLTFTQSSSDPLHEFSFNVSGSVSSGDNVILATWRIDPTLYDSFVFSYETGGASASSLFFTLEMVDGSIKTSTRLISGGQTYEILDLRDVTDVRLIYFTQTGVNVENEWIRIYDYYFFTYNESPNSPFEYVQHTPGSFGEFLCNNFSVHELTKIVSNPAIKAVSSLNEGNIAPSSAYVLYTISAYAVYIMAIWLVMLILKVVTFIPVAITNWLDKLGGAS